MNFGLATRSCRNTPGLLRGRVSAVFGLSFFGLMPIGRPGRSRIFRFDRNAHCACRCRRHLRRDHRRSFLSSAGRQCAIDRFLRYQNRKWRRSREPSLGRNMISFSTCWNSHRHTDGDEMLREILELGFDRIELGHGIRISLMPGIQKMFDAGEVQFSSLHNFCPLPVEVLGASPDCYQFSSASPNERERAVKQTFQTIDFAERFRRAIRCPAFGRSAECGPSTDSLIALAEKGRTSFAKICSRKNPRS